VVAVAIVEACRSQSDIQTKFPPSHPNNYLSIKLIIIKK